MADSPEAAARACSHARCRQDCEHHFGSRPVALTAMGPPHQPQVWAANRRGCAATSSSGTRLAPASADAVLGGDGGWRLSPRTCGRVRCMPFRWRLPMPSSIRAVVHGAVTPMRHDGSLALDAPGVWYLILLLLQCRERSRRGSRGLAITDWDRNVPGLGRFWNPRAAWAERPARTGESVLAIGDLQLPVRQGSAVPKSRATCTTDVIALAGHGASRRNPARYGLGTVLILPARPQPHRQRVNRTGGSPRRRLRA
jgi:hypothetical protein